MPGIEALRQLLIGQEASTDPGTAVAATALLRFEGMWSDDREIVFPNENVGLISGRDRAYTSRLYATMAMSGPATFEQLPYILEAGVASVTPTTDAGGGSGYIYTYTFPTSDQGSGKTYTIEAGDDQAEEEASYAFVSDVSLSGVAGEAWQVEANWGARQVSTDTFTPSSDLTVAEVEEMLFLKTKLYIDNDTDSLGTTQKSNTLLEATLTFPGWIPVWTADGNLYFSFIKRPSLKDNFMLDITFEHDGTATAEKNAWRNDTARLIRLICEGGALTTTGTYGVKTMIIDVAGKWESFDVLGSRDGNDIVTGHFKVRYNENASHFAQIVIVNETASLP